MRARRSNNISSATSSSRLWEQIKTLNLLKPNSKKKTKITKSMISSITPDKQERATRLHHHKVQTAKQSNIPVFPKRVLKLAKLWQTSEPMIAYFHKSMLCLLQEAQRLKDSTITNTRSTGRSTSGSSSSSSSRRGGDLWSNYFDLWSTYGPMLTFDLPMLTFDLPHVQICRHKRI